MCAYGRAPNDRRHSMHAQGLAADAPLHHRLDERAVYHIGGLGDSGKSRGTANACDMPPSPFRMLFRDRSPSTSTLSVEDSRKPVDCNTAFRILSRSRFRRVPGDAPPLTENTLAFCWLSLCGGTNVAGYCGACGPSKPPAPCAAPPAVRACLKSGMPGIDTGTEEPMRMFRVAAAETLPKMPFMPPGVLNGASAVSSSAISSSPDGRRFDCDRPM
mmetsp:Transcript_40087/g.119395  ORF Transcript_40087/g.119395 Transcript_40087/m.119395 type:complete len:216 (-) Transcript_40087:481-1128(-)